MKMKKSLLLITFLTFFLTFLFLVMPNNSVYAATTSPPASTTVAPADTSKSILEINGLNGNEAQVTDMNGNAVQSSDNLYTWLNFNVKYNWSIADDVSINAGDTAEFTLPEGIVAAGDTSFPVYNGSGVEIGTVDIKNGESFGTITFNDAISDINANRKGTLSLIGKGTNPGNGTQGENWMFNKLGWIASYSSTGIPNQLTWNIAFNPNEHNLNSVVITDTLANGQEYIPGSLTAIAGSYNSNGFVSNGQELNPTVTTSGNTVTITFPGNVTTAVDIYYRVSVTPNANDTNTWTNNATMTSNEGTFNVSGSVSWGGSATGTGEQKVGTVTLQKTDTNSGNGLSGAEYELKDSKGKVIISNATTDSDGKLVIQNLPYGNYTLTEVKAPDGYELNQTPINIVLPLNGSIDLNFNQKDTPDPGGVILTKLDPDSQATIAGATFNLLDSTGKVIKENLVTDGNGEIAVDDLAVGQYTFIETKPAAGYELNATPTNFTVVSNQITPVVLEKFNIDKTTISNSGEVVLTKVDATTNAALPGAIYNLVDSNGKIIESGLTTDKNGQIEISDLEAGNYSFIEVTSPNGYELNKEPISFTVTKDLTNTLEAKDEKTPSSPGTTTPPENPSNPQQPNNPGTTNPPVKPNNPGNPDAPIVKPEKPGVTNPPAKPSKPNSPNVKPEKPGVTNPSKPEAPIVKPENPNITNPSKPETPIINPENPNEPEASVPNVTAPENPNAINPAPNPDEILSPNNNSDNTTPVPETSSDYGKGKFPQTGNKSGWILMVIGLVLGITIIIKKRVKHEI
ncbi:SpaA isopeptide-forming pilin-related protein [Companilactobacillus halodurans]|uniref:LPXTG cell wall anchor domain-containing protein n=1 Tax=Companilactobacillus halodurans TaxID=2584183 RepID=A0A5P0ZR83_9LACO|nr:SpaA isopeptide-forming pilin-related protein [Companilactobacillus halodurans]MQS76575.1 hypothetical protein [Companilactobacillus halodurans]MQS98501.1 hypothetical protein [Companilactobacillus halodurans]